MKTKCNKSLPTALKVRNILAMGEAHRRRELSLLALKGRNIKQNSLILKTNFTLFQ